jgi:predicted ATPase
MFLKSITINQSKFPSTDVYPYHLKVFKETSKIELTSKVTFFAGENGSGKSTLLSAIARKSNIYMWCQNEYSPLVFNKYSDTLHQALEITYTEMVQGAFFSAQSFKRYAELVDEWAKTDVSSLNYHGGEALTLRSHGQTHMQYFRNRFKIKGLYLLDEPESALSPKSQIEFLKVIREAVDRNNTQFIIATHSPILLGFYDAVILNFDSIPISPIDYELTDYYTLYKDLITNREKYRNLNTKNLSE